MLRMELMVSAVVAQLVAGVRAEGVSFSAILGTACGALGEL